MTRQEHAIIKLKEFGYAVEKGVPLTREEGKEIQVLADSLAGNVVEEKYQKAADLFYSLPVAQRKEVYRDTDAAVFLGDIAHENDRHLLSQERLNAFYITLTEVLIRDFHTRERV